jgi:hypothetical protein
LLRLRDCGLCRCQSLRTLPDGYCGGGGSLCEGGHLSPDQELALMPIVGEHKPILVTATGQFACYGQFW